MASAKKRSPKKPAPENLAETVERPVVVPPEAIPPEDEETPTGEAADDVIFEVTPEAPPEAAPLAAPPATPPAVAHVANVEGCDVSVSSAGTVELSRRGRSLSLTPAQLEAVSHIFGFGGHQGLADALREALRRLGSGVQI